MAKNEDCVEKTPQKEPCRFCGSLTKQRAEGIPYCSMDCIDHRRRENNGEMVKCPYPDCDWHETYRPDNGLSRAVAYKRSEDHRQEHREELEAGSRD